jgi:hypothetical protein
MIKPDSYTPWLERPGDSESFEGHISPAPRWTPPAFNRFPSAGHESADQCPLKSPVYFNISICIPIETFAQGIRKTDFAPLRLLHIVKTASPPYRLTRSVTSG